MTESPYEKAQRRKGKKRKDQRLSPVVPRLIDKSEGIGGEDKDLGTTIHNDIPK